MSEPTYKTQGSRVYGNGQSYTVHNKITAEQLCSTLNHLEQTTKLSKNITHQYDKLTRQIIQLKLSVNTLREEIQSLEQTIEELK